MTSADEHRSPQDRAADLVADLVLYAPLGLVLDARRLFPELAARGRRQILFTRTIGKYTVRRGQQHLDELVGTGLGLVASWTASSGPEDARNDLPAPSGPPVRLVAAPAGPGPDPDGLAIPDYDSLSAFQVMPRLEALDATDLDAVRAYEESTRGRRTILNKIAQLS